MDDVFDVLRADHRQAVEHLEVLLAAPHLRSEQHLRLNVVTQELVMATSTHEAIEEMYFWPVLRQTGEEGAALAKAGLAQEQESQWVLAGLANRTPSDPGFDEVLTRFSDGVRAHISFEEGLVWPFLSGLIDDDERQQLGIEMRRARRTAPTRPHPAGPHGPIGLKTVGVASGLVDRALNALTGRGRHFEGDGA